LDPVSSGSLLSAVFVSGAIGWRRGYIGAKPFTVAYAGVLVGILVGTLCNGLVFPGNDWTNAAPPLGVAWEAVFLALALAERIDRLRGERDVLKVEALVDALTGIANRRDFDRRLAEEWRRGLRGRTPVATILIDVDFFKSYNDQYGHVAGDGALKLVAGILTSSSRRSDDFVARYGGEEFVLLLPYCDVADAVDVADALRRKVQALAIAHAANPSGRLTISAGAAGAVPTIGTTAEELVAAADRALYVAKRTGRNRVSEATALIA
jgi:diguanylate cyclase (GGDEF)-like protein